MKKKKAKKILKSIIKHCRKITYHGCLGGICIFRRDINKDCIFTEGPALWDLKKYVKCKGE